MIIYTAFLPHPPIMLPAIGGEECQKITATIQSQETISAEIKALEKQTDLLLIMSPHAQAGPDYFPFYIADNYRGSLAKFGRPDIGIELNGDKVLAEDLVNYFQKNKLDIQKQFFATLDHGILVPLFVLAKNNYKKPILFCGLNIYQQREHYLLGQLLADYAKEKNKNIVFVGSGDMSHALKEDGPYQYHPAGPKFDKKIVELIKKGEEAEFLNIPGELQENAAECGFRSLLTIAGIKNRTKTAGEVLSYEGPFGVGYLSARWK